MALSNHDCCRWLSNDNIVFPPDHGSVATPWSFRTLPLLCLFHNFLLGFFLKLPEPAGHFGRPLNPPTSQDALGFEERRPRGVFGPARGPLLEIENPASHLFARINVPSDQLFCATPPRRIQLSKGLEKRETTGLLSHLLCQTGGLFSKLLCHRLLLRHWLFCRYGSLLFCELLRWYPLLLCCGWLLCHALFLWHGRFLRFEMLCPPSAAFLP